MSGQRHQRRIGMIRTFSLAYEGLPKPLQLFVFLACLLTTFALASTVAWRLVGYGLPYSAPSYLVPSDLFSDFEAFRPRFKTFGSPAFFTNFPGEYAMYPAPLLFVIAAFMRMPHPIRSFLCFSVIVLISTSVLLFKTLLTTGISKRCSGLFTFVTLATSYPVLFLLHRGNLEIVVWIPITVGLLLFNRQRYSWAAVAFGIATSLKLYPFMFISLLIIKRRLWEAGLAALTTVAVSGIALWRLGPNITAAFRWNGIQLRAFGKYFAASDWALGYDHSFFSLVKLATLSHHLDLTPYVHQYSISIALTGILVFVLILWRIPQLNQILVLSIFSVAMPPVSYDYTLLSLYAAFTMLCMLAIRAKDLDQKVKGLNAQMVLFAILFTPDSFIIINGARFAGQARALCLLCSSILALLYPLEVRDEQSHVGPACTPDTTDKACAHAVIRI